jgi:hypothetical protein
VWRYRKSSANYSTTPSATTTTKAASKALKKPLLRT